MRLTGLIQIIKSRREDEGIIKLNFINMLHEADRSINAPQPKAIQQPKKSIYNTGNLPNHEHVQERTRGKCHRTKRKSDGGDIDQILGTVSRGT